MEVRREIAEVKEPGGGDGGIKSDGEWKGEERREREREERRNVKHSGLTIP